MSNQIQKNGIGSAHPTTCGGRVQTPVVSQQLEVVKVGTLSMSIDDEPRPATDGLSWQEKDVTT